MKLTVTESVSLDGVMQGLGGPDEDRRGAFERGGWQIPLSDEEVGAFLDDVYARADAFLFGRRTYEIFAGSWGTMKDPSRSPIGQALNSRRAPGGSGSSQSRIMSSMPTGLDTY